MLHPVRVVSVAAILRSPRRLHVRRAPRLRTECAQERRGMRSARADLHVIRLQQGTTSRVPVVLELEYDLLKSEHRVAVAWEASPILLDDRRATPLRGASAAAGPRGDV